LPTDLDALYDVAISGAGLAGASLALSLAARGLRVAVVDPATFPRDKLCGEFLSPECWEVFERLGLSGEIERSGFHAIRKVLVTTPRGREVVADVTGPDDPPGIGLSRSMLDDLLVRSARAAGATVIEGARARGPTLDADGRVSGLLIGDHGLRARVTIAADGRHSALVRQTGTIRARRWTRRNHVGLKRHLWAWPRHSEPDGTVGLHVFAGGYGGTCLVEGGLTNLCAMVPEAAIRSRKGDLDLTAREILGRNPSLARLLDASQPGGSWKTVSGVRVETSDPNVPGILYAGDCMGTVDPLGGQGMTMALLGAEAIAPFVVRGLAGGIDARLQAEWRAEWRGRFDRRVRLCAVFHEVLTRPGLVDAASRLGRGASRLLTECYRWTREPVGNGAAKARRRAGPR